MSDNNQSSLPRIIIKYVPYISIKIEESRSIEQRSIGCNTVVTTIQQQQVEEDRYCNNCLNFSSTEPDIHEATAEQRLMDNIEASLCQYLSDPTRQYPYNDLLTWFFNMNDNRHSRFILKIEDVCSGSVE